MPRGRNRDKEVRVNEKPTLASAQLARVLGKLSDEGFEEAITEAPWKSVRPFKVIFCHDLSEFESTCPATQSALVAHIRHLKKFTTLYTVSATKARAAASRGVALARTISSVPRLALRQKAVRRSHRLRHDNWVIGSRCGRNSFSSGTTSVLRAVFASRDEPMASAPALPEATVSGQFVQIFGRKEN